MEDLPGKITDWLEDLEKDPSQIQKNHELSTNSSAKTLLKRAAFCYAMAQWHGDACRVFEEVGDFKSAAFYHEREERWSLAAQCYSNASDWENAARCFLSAKDPDRAADCYLKAGKKLLAAWLLAHLSKKYINARNIIQDLQKDKSDLIIGNELVIARCEAGQQEAVASAKRLRRVLINLDNTDQHIQWTNWIEWSQAIAEILQRPDLMIEIHAIAYRLNIPQARENWLRWANKNLGDVVGIPFEKRDNELSDNPIS